MKGGVIESKSDESLETSETATEKRELRIDDLNIDIEGDAPEEEGKQQLGDQSKSRNSRSSDSDMSDDVGEEGSLNST